MRWGFFMFRVTRLLLLIGGIVSISFIVPPPALVTNGGTVYTATSSGFVDDAARERDDKVFAALVEQATASPDAFGDIAASLYNAARERTFAVGRLYELASSLDAATGGSPGIQSTLKLQLADARMLVCAHLLFKRFAEHEREVREAAGLSPEMAMAS